MKSNGGFASLLKTERARSGLSLRALGAKIGFSGQAISWWESGRCLPDAKRVRSLVEKLAAVLPVKEEEIHIAIEQSYTSSLRDTDILPTIKAITQAGLKSLSFNHLKQILTTVNGLGGEVSPELVRQISRHVQSQP